MELIAQIREKLGKKAKNLTHEKKFPAVMFGKDVESLPLAVNLVDFIKVYKKAGETSLIDLNIDGKKEKVLISDIQLDPVRGMPLHVSFHKVNLKEKITAEIPVVVVGDDDHPLVKSGEALVLTLLNEISVEALPADLPHEFKVDVSKLKKVGDGVTVSQLEYDKDKVEILDIEPDALIVKMDSAQMAEEPVEEVVSEEDALAKIEATEELTEEEKKEREEAEKEAKDKE